MSVANPRLAGPQRFGTIFVVGGGCYGRYYVRQLRRAAGAGAVQCDRVVVVDRDPQCAVAQAVGPGDPLVTVAASEWRAYFAARLGRSGRRDAIVPSPLMPHLLRDWLLDAARARWPGRDVRVAPLPYPPDVPWERAAPDGTHYVSYATWMCPVNCIEPDTCPHTRSSRSWSLAPTLHGFADRMRRDLGHPVPSFMFRCLHRAYGVGMIDVADVLAADAAIAAAGAGGQPVDALVGTVSHCHGAVSRLVAAEAPVGAPPA